MLDKFSFLLFFSLKTIFDLVYFIILEEKTRRLDLESSRKWHLSLLVLLNKLSPKQFPWLDKFFSIFLVIALFMLNTKANLDFKSELSYAAV